MKKWFGRFFNQKDKQLNQGNNDLTMYRNIAMMRNDEVLRHFDTSFDGLTTIQVGTNTHQYGTNVLTHGRINPLSQRIIAAFINPFTIILMVLAIVSLFTDILLVETTQRNYVTVTIITLMVVISGCLRFIQETRSGNAALQLQNMITTTACVKRYGQQPSEIPLADIVVGDIVYLSAGDLIPADLRLIQTKDLFVAQSALTGESEPVEKMDGPITNDGPLTDMQNIVFCGSNVISGSAKGIVIAVGNTTLIGGMAKALDTRPEASTFEKGVNAISWTLIRFMLIMVPIVFMSNGLTKGDWLHAFLFAISIAVGLTPEMLPMIVTTNLAKGAITMSHKKVIIKNLNAIQNLGSMDILCTDKTGTLTQDKIVLEQYLNVDGHQDPRVLRHAYLNSYFQTGLKNLIDRAVIARQDQLGSAMIRSMYQKVDEIPFDFARRRMSVVVQDKNGKRQMVTKGAVEEMLTCCSYAEVNGLVKPRLIS